MCCILHVFNHCYFYCINKRPIISVQVTTNELRSRITSLQAALERAREETAARTEHEAKLTSQFQVHGSSLWVVVLL